MQLVGIRGAIVLGAAAACWAGGAQAACQLQIISEYHITMDGNEPLVDATINGTAARLKVDLGSANTIISRVGAERLGIKPHRMDNVTFYGVGGGEVPGEAIIQELKIGNEVARNVDLMIVGRGLNSSRYIGLLGQDLLSQADVEFDFANNAMRIIKPKGCNGDQVVYWNKPYSLASIVPSNDPRIVEVYVALNGSKAIAQIDTGAYTSIVTTAMAERAGVKPGTENTIASGTSKGIAGNAVQTSVAVFSSFSIGDESISNAKLRIADMFGADTRKEIGSLIAKRLDDVPDMLLGADFIRSHRIYVARSQGKMYFSYNGGPIFQVIAPPAVNTVEARDNPAPVKP
jgi:predicted aspartyl protease